jgi:hypothetical protein
MGLSERTFEFCFNSEFCQKNRALLASHPYIPSQRQEKDLGYDVEFEIRNHHFTRSMFLQHKVVSYAENRSGRNAQFYNAHGGAYYRFPIDKGQHNVLVKLSNQRGNVFYCAPRFHNRSELESYFRGDTIVDNSIWLNPFTSGQISDSDTHNITFDPTGSFAFLHSEIRKVRSITSINEYLPQLEQQHIDVKYVEALSEELIALTWETRLAEQIPKKIRELRPIERVQYILGHLYDVSWILIE